MPRKARHRVAADTGLPDRRGRRAGTGDALPGRPRNHQLPTEVAMGRPWRPVHTIKVSTFFL
ncbi:hypothetical protein ACFXGT_33885 [Streptomyces sp. NPDC059352]|uniref:hypothetical protein n=1 Tax=Streptomyces sp. NPDC059352 TaxID=3346810 RepID=UPI0036AD81BA